MDTEALIEQGLAALAVPAPSDAVERLARYLALLAKWNRGQNLTAVTDVRDMVPRHVLDSLAGSPWVGAHVLDVGSGAGLPGVPLAVTDPARQVTLLDSRGKRIQFLTHAKHALALDNVTVDQARFEKYRAERKFDTLTARAFAALPDLVHDAAPFITAGARLVVWTGSDPSPELAATRARRPFSYTVHPVMVPGLAARRHIVVVEDAG